MIVQGQNCKTVARGHVVRAAAPVAEQLRALFLNHSIISPLCLVWVRAPHCPHVRQAKFCLRVCYVVFLGVLPFSPTYRLARLIRAEIILKSKIKNQKIKKKLINKRKKEKRRAGGVRRPCDDRAVTPRFFMIIWGQNRTWRS